MINNLGSSALALTGVDNHPQSGRDIRADGVLTSKDLATRGKKRGGKKKESNVSKWALKRMASKLLPGWSVCSCMIQPIDGVGSIPLIHVPETQSGVIGGVKRCRSVWTCPYCATEISEGRREECREAADKWRALKEKGGFGGRLVLVTYTVRHKATTPVKWLVEQLRAAYRKMKQSGNYRRLCDAYGVAGSVTTMELKHGDENGWHPHFHELLFVPSEFILSNFDEGLRHLWEMATAKFGLSVNEFGLHLEDCDQKIADYITKVGYEPAWTEVEEMSKWHLKTGESAQRLPHEHYTPFELLRFAMEGDERAGELFIEYAGATYRKSQMRWKTGFREFLGLEKEKDEEDFINEHIKEGVVMTELNINEEWPIIVGNDVVPELKDILATGNMESLCEFLGMFGIERSPAIQPHVIDLDERRKIKKYKETFVMINFLLVVQGKKAIGA
jgi:hypothetical protein